MLQWSLVPSTQVAAYHLPLEGVKRSLLFEKAGMSAEIQPSPHFLFLHKP